MRRCSGQLCLLHTAKPSACNMIGASPTMAARACTATRQLPNVNHNEKAPPATGGDRVVLNRLLAQLRRSTPPDGAQISDSHVRMLHPSSPPDSASPRAIGAIKEIVTDGDGRAIVADAPDRSRTNLGRRRQRFKVNKKNQSNAAREVQRQQSVVAACPSSIQPLTTPAAARGSEEGNKKNLEPRVENKTTSLENDRFFHPRRVYNPLATMSLPPRQRHDFSLLVKHPQYVALRERCTAAFQSINHGAAPYALAVLEECVRPLLSLTGFAFDIDEIVQYFLPCLESAPLKLALQQYGPAASIFVFVNPIDGATMVLDGSRETFVRRFYPAVHLSWEPVEIVARRLGFAANHVPRDMLVTFLSQFTADGCGGGGGGEASAPPLIELAILCRTHQSRMLTTEPLRVVGRSSPAVTTDGGTEEGPTRGERMLALDKEALVVVRRVHGANTPLSVVETLRMVGAPATAYPRKKKVGAVQQSNASNNNAGYYQQRGADTMEIFTIGTNLQLTAAALAAKTPDAGQHQPPSDVDRAQFLLQAARKAVPLEQAMRSRINEFSVPQRFLEGSKPQGADQNSPHQAAYPSTSLHQQNWQQHHGHHGVQRNDAQRRAGASGKEIHDVKVRIVTLKQRAKMATGSERIKLLEELGVARAKLLKLVPTPPTSAPTETAAAAAASAPLRRKVEDDVGAIVPELSPTQTTTSVEGASTPATAKAAANPPPVVQDPLEGATADLPQTDAAACEVVEADCDDASSGAIAASDAATSDVADPERPLPTSTPGPAESMSPPAKRRRTSKKATEGAKGTADASSNAALRKKKLKSKKQQTDTKS